MTECILCSKPLDTEADYNDDREHIVCKAEWQKRRDNIICTRCGDKLAKDKDSYWCDNCSLGTPYLNYPGPQ